MECGDDDDFLGLGGVAGRKQGWCCQDGENLPGESCLPGLAVVVVTGAVPA